MGGGPRYAIYFVPAAQSDLYRYGSAILGYDCYTGQTVDFPEELQSDTVTWRELTSAPRSYGFHATLKAPFHLPARRVEAELVEAMQKFARLGHAVGMIKPAIRLVDNFFAVVPAEPVATLNALAASCTTAFDAFRAPMSPPERDRRIASGLSPIQVQNLDRWGYPYVLSEFRFHMTLTGNVEARRHDMVLAVLESCTQRLRANQPILIDRLALLKQDSPHSGFRVVSQSELGGA